MKMQIYSFPVFQSRVLGTIALSWRLLVTLLLLFTFVWGGNLPAKATVRQQQLEVELDTPFEITAGEQAIVADTPNSLFVLFSGPFSDERCPSDVHCVAAGDATFIVIAGFEEAMATDIVYVGTAPKLRKAHFEGYEIELVKINTPAPKQGETLPPEAYRVTLVVRVAEVAEDPTPTPTEETSGPQTSTPQTNVGFDPIIVDRCRNFTPYDAAAILQEEVNAAAPIGNILFGPLPEDMGEVTDGLCGYTNLIPVNPDAVNASQTHIATALGYNHGVVAEHLTAKLLYSTSGTVLSDWMDLFLLAEVVSTANPQTDGNTFEYLYTAFNVGDNASLMDRLYAEASAAPSFKAVKVQLDKDDPRDELLWLWQTLEDGYFALLISRQGEDFDVVAARLGNQVTEKTVLGYAQVILEKIAATNPETNANQNVVGCERLTLDDVEAIVGEAMHGQAVANENGEGCKYTPKEDNLTIDPTDFSPLFETFGLLAGIAPPKATERLLSGMVEELSTTGQVTDGDALTKILNAIQAGNWPKALPMMAGLEWGSTRWQVEALSEVGDDALLITGKSGNGWSQFFLLHPRAADGGGVYYLTGVLRSEIDEVRDALGAAIQKLADEIVVMPTATATDDEKPTVTPPAEESTTTAGCGLLTLEQVEAILGEAVEEHEVVGERGAGCKYTPAAAHETVEPDDFSPSFENYGVLAGVMAVDAAQWLLSDLITEVGLGEDELAELQTTLDAGEIETALQRLSVADLLSGDWQAAGLPMVSADALWVHQEQEGELLSFFFRSQLDGGLFVIAVHLSADHDAQAMYDAVIGTLLELAEGSN